MNGDSKISPEWVRTFILAASFIVTILWQASEIKADFRVQLAQIQQELTVYAKDHERVNALEIGDVRLMTWLQEIIGKKP